MNRRTTTAVLATVGSLIFAGASIAAPPSVVDQYTEQAPPPGGSQPGNGGNSGGQGDSTGGTTQSGGDSQDGGVGAAGQTGGGSGPGSVPSGSSGGAGSGSETSGGSGGQAEGSESSLNPGQGSGAITPTSTEDGLGLVFPIALIVLLGGATLIVLRQRGARSA